MQKAAALSFCFAAIGFATSVTPLLAQQAGTESEVILQEFANGLSMESIWDEAPGLTDGELWDLVHTEYRVGGIS